VNAGRGRRAVSRVAGSALFGNFDARISKYNKMAADRQAQLSETGDDSLVYAGGGYEEDGKYYNSKHDEITKGAFVRGKALYGGSTHSLGQAIGWRLRKSQTDEDVGQVRKAFEKNAVANNWTQEEAMDVWASATYPLKGQNASEWYSTPQVRGRTSSGGGRTTGVDYKDISNNEGSYNKYIGDLHKTRQAFRLNEMRDSDWRAMLGKQQALQAKVTSGGTLSTPEAKQLAETYEVFDAASHIYSGRGAGIEGQEDTVSAQGGTAAASPIIKLAIEERNRAGVKLRVDSANQRSILHGERLAGQADVTGGTDRDAAVNY
jgi:hypothetical protein